MKTPRHPAFAANVRSSSSSAKLMVAWAIHCLCRFACGQGAEQLLGTRDVFRTRADEVVVHHQDPFLTDRLEFAHDIRERAAAGIARR